MHSARIELALILPLNYECISGPSQTRTGVKGFKVLCDICCYKIIKPSTLWDQQAFLPKYISFKMFK